jgi:hypothetical protein
MDDGEMSLGEWIWLLAVVLLALLLQAIGAIE